MEDISFFGRSGGSGSSSGGSGELIASLVRKPTRNDFPVIGDTQKIYLATDENDGNGVLYWWNAALQNYIPLTGIAIPDPEQDFLILSEDGQQLITESGETMIVES